MKKAQKKMIPIVVGIVILVALIWVGMQVLKPKKFTPSKGLTIEVLKDAPTGKEVKKGQLAKVHYTGWLTDGTKFDSSKDRNEPFEFRVGEKQVIRGWDLGVEGMHVGEIRKLTIASDLGYGSQGAGSVIPPDATLIFEIELLDVAD